MTGIFRRRQQSYKRPTGPQFVQVAGQVFTGSTQQASLSAVCSATGAGHSLLIFAKYGGGIVIPGAGTAVADSRGNTWTADDLYTTNFGASCNIYRCQAPTALQAGDTVTINTGAAQGSWGFFVVEVSGLAHGVDEIGNQGQQGVAGGTVTQGNMTSYDNEIAFSMWAQGGSPPQGTIYAPSSGWTSVGTLDQNWTVGLAYQILTARGTQSCTWSGGVSANNSSALVTYG